MVNLSATSGKYGGEANTSEFSKCELSFVNHFLRFFASEFESLVLVSFCLPHGQARVDVPALKNICI